MKPLLLLTALLLPGAHQAQPEPWAPPATRLPQSVVTDAAFLLAHGMGDPRGSEYRSAKVVLGTLWGRDTEPFEVNGWVRKGSLVAPNGLAYDVVELGKPADLAADVQKEIERWNPAKGPHLRLVRAQGPLWGPVAVRLLLVAGEAGFAERYHAALPGDPNRSEIAVHTEFLTAVFDQAVTAHMRGDDGLALRVARLLARHREAYEAEGTRLEGRRKRPGPQGLPEETEEKYAFLRPVPALIADAERRLAHPRKALKPGQIKGLGPKALVERLDEVAERQMGQPGGVRLANDPIVAALVRAGDAAVEPIFEALERDDRLTRAVSFARDFHPVRNLVTVRTAAYAAFRAIAQTDDLPTDVAALRAYWKENGRKSPADRWFDALADDAAGKSRWEEAATRLFDRVGTQRSGIWSTIPPDGPTNAEAVRGRANPSLSDLLERRAREIAASDPHSSRGFSLGPALRIATKLGRWDPARGRALLRDITRESLDAVATDRMQFYYMEKHVVPALEARAAAGDRETWPDYVAFLGKLHRHRYDGAAEAFRPVIEHADVPGMKAAAVALFTDPASDWDFATRFRKYGGPSTMDPVVFSPLLALPELRAVVLAALTDPAPIGTVHVEGNGLVRTEIGKDRSGGGNPDVLTDPLRPKPGERRPYRVKDNVAGLFRRLQGAPKFQPYWPDADKDRAIAELAATIRKLGPTVVERWAGLTTGENHRPSEAGKALG